MSATAAVVGVYRARNAGRVRRLVDPALERGWQAAWWALDEVVGDLAPFTVGAGAGPRIALLNRVLERAAIRPGWSS